MATSKYTANLHLCDWADTDRPKRADFVSDNNIIDKEVGGHIANGSIHLSAGDKAKISEPFVRILYAGSGASERTVEIGFTPKFVIVYKRNVSPVVYSGGVCLINSGYACYGLGGTAGITVTAAGVTVTQASTSTNGVKVNLNENGGQYTVVAFK